MKDKDTVIRENETKHSWVYDGPQFPSEESAAMEEEEEEKVTQRDVAKELKYAACAQTLFPLWRFYRVAQSNRETTFCCFSSQKLFVEKLGYGKRVWNRGT